MSRVLTLRGATYVTQEVLERFKDRLMQWRIDAQADVRGVWLTPPGYNLTEGTDTVAQLYDFTTFGPLEAYARACMSQAGVNFNAQNAAIAATGGSKYQQQKNIINNVSPWMCIHANEVCVSQVQADQETNEDKGWVFQRHVLPVSLGKSDWLKRKPDRCYKLKWTTSAEQYESNSTSNFSLREVP